MITRYNSSCNYRYYDNQRLSVVATGVISSYHLAIVTYDYHNISVVATGVISSYHLTIVIFDYHKTMVK